MIRKFGLLIAGLIMTISVMAQSTWESDIYHSKLTFSTTHLGIADIPGWFESFEVSVVTDKDNFSDAVFELTVDVNSINTAVEMRDNHLRSEDFFHVEKYPTMTYKSTKIRRAGRNKYKLTGNLTLHGVTKEVTMNLWYRGTTENPQSGALTAGFQLTGTINRSDFNIGPDFPNAMISDKVKIKADGEFIKQ